MVRIEVPALRERKEDIPLLCATFIEDLNRQHRRWVEGLAPEALTTLFQYDWPGNVREPKNILESVLVTLSSAHITQADLPERLRASQRGTSPVV